MRRTAAAVLTLLLLAAFAAPALADHPGFNQGPVTPGLSTGVNSGGEGAEWELLFTVPTGNPHSDLDFFTQGGETFVSVGTIGTGGNSGGQTILQLTAEGEVDPVFLAGHPSAGCTSDPSSVLGLQHDVEATPKGDVLFNTEVVDADRRDAQVLLDASDAWGRCHDQGATGTELDAPFGGLEIIDITDPSAPVEIGLTTHIGEAHTVNVDPRRPHIAYVVSSDSVRVAADADDCDGDGDVEELIRANECDGGGLDGFEIVDLSSCMDFPAGTTVEEKREACNPLVYRYRYPTLNMTLGHTLLTFSYACHELEVYPEDRLTCASGNALLLFDINAMFDDAGTPDDFSDDTVNGDPLPCRRRPSSSAIYQTGASVIDCVAGEDDADLNVTPWLAAGAPSVAGIEHIGTAYHAGRAATNQVAPYTSDEDIDFNHEAEFTHSRNFLLATDERGGGVAPPGAACSPGIDNPLGNGGIHAYATERLFAQRPVPVTTADASTFDAEVAWQSYALDSEGEKAIYRTGITTGPQASICTAHVFQQVPGQNRIFMGWYSQGTRVLDYVENPDGTIDFTEVGYFTTENADQWVSHVFDAQDNGDGTWTYHGVAADFNITGGGRNAIDIYRVTLPAPLQFAQVPGVPPVGVEIVREAGAGRVETAVAVSEEGFDAADTVVLARADDYADALAGGPLAADRDAPILLTDSAALPEATAAEIERLGASEAVLLGGESAISPAVEAELLTMGVTSERIGGENRFETAALVADALSTQPLRAFITEGEHAEVSRGWPDALAASPYAAFSGEPVLLVNAERYPEETAAALEALDPDEVVVVGGDAAVSDVVVAAIEADGHTTRRVAGTTRYETARAVYDEAVAAGMDATVLWLATGRNFPDALAAGPTVAALGQSFLLVDGSSLAGSPPTQAAIEERVDTIVRIHLLGGESAIAESVREELLALFATDEQATVASFEPAPAGPPRSDLALLAAALLLVPLAAVVRRRRTVPSAPA